MIGAWGGESLLKCPPESGKCSARGVSVLVSVNACVAAECAGVVARVFQNICFCCCFCPGGAVYVVLTWAYVRKDT